MIHVQNKTSSIFLYILFQNTLTLSYVVGLSGYSASLPLVDDRQTADSTLHKYDPSKFFVKYYLPV